MTRIVVGAVLVLFVLLCSAVAWHMTVTMNRISSDVAVLELQMKFLRRTVLSGHNQDSNAEQQRVVQAQQVGESEVPAISEVMDDKHRQNIYADILGFKKGMSIEDVHKLEYGVLRRSMNDMDAWIISDSPMLEDIKILWLFISEKEGLLKNDHLDICVFRQVRQSR